MDKVIKKKYITRRKILISIPVVIAIFLFVKIIVLQDYNPAYRVRQSEIILSVVSEREITRSIQTIGLIEPIDRISIETGEYGQIIEIINNTGSYVNNGAPILKLVNEDLVNEYNSMMESLDWKIQFLELCRDKFNIRQIGNKESLLELEYKLESLNNISKRNTMLFNIQSISKEELENSRIEYEFWQQKKEIFHEKWESEKIVQSSEEAVIELEIKSINKKLDFMKTRIERLMVVAPYSGILNLEEMVIGQSIGKQQKIGAIERQDQFKMTASIDEFYLSDVNLGDIAVFEYKGEKEVTCEAELVFISPEVRGSSINLEFSFSTALPDNILSGQSFSIKILQDKPAIRKVVEYGSFYKESAGNWVFKIEDNHAVKVPVTIGIKNNDFVEILSGLNLGDQIIISNYIKYKDFDKLIIEEI